DQAFFASNTSVKGVAEVRSAMEVLESFDLTSVAAAYTPDPAVSQSETGVEVLSSSFPISRTKWAIIGEEPVSSVYSAINRVSFIALIIFLVSIPAAVSLVLLATRNIITPIRQLTEGAVRMGDGDFGHRLNA